MKKLEKKDIIELVLLIIILAFIFVIVLKTLVISSMIGKERKCEEIENVYEKISFENANNLKSYNIYKKNDKVKTIIYTKRSGKITCYTELNEDSYSSFEGETNKETEEYEGKIFDVTFNYFFADTIWDIINDALICKIGTETTEEGIKCYVFENMYDKAKLKEEGIKNVKLYIDKSTGLPVQRVEENDDGSSNTIRFEFTFNTVTDRDVKRPATSGMTER